jgi:hypothetical protein
MYELGLKIEKKLVNKFEEPLHELYRANEEMIVFDYPHYLDKHIEHFEEQIKEETEFLLTQTTLLEENEYKGNYFVNDYVIETNS